MSMLRDVRQAKAHQAAAPDASFSRQLTTCRQGKSWGVLPTEQERQLSHLSRPGMNGGRRIKQILLPGKYAFRSPDDPVFERVDSDKTDVAEVRKNSIRTPRMIRIRNVTWRQHQELRWSAYLENNLDEIVVPVDEANDANLGYYNCRILRAQDVISLNHRSIVVDFDYRTEYLDQYVIAVLGSSLIEQHDFAHVDTPLDDRSGYLVIGKTSAFDQSLELTAFSVNPRDSVYIPAKTIHTNDYLLGTWQTLLSSACEFPSAQIKPPSGRPLAITFER